MAAALAVVVCGGPVVATERVALPFQRVVTVEAAMGSKSDYFEDPEVRRLLMRHGIRVHLTRMGSRDIAHRTYTGFDVVFPSGQPAADSIARRRAAEGRPATAYRPFVSPIVLGTYREYAETLTDAGIATPMPAASPGTPTLYYRLDMRKFLDATAAGRRWKDLGIEDHGLHNDNRVLAQTSDICESNSAGTYLGLVSYVDHTVGKDRGKGEIPQTPAAAEEFGRDITMLLNDQGMPASEKNETYVSAEGKSIAPVAVIYEHQFLAHQIRATARTGRVDAERVLLYPSTRFFTEPRFIALTARGERLGELMSGDGALRERARELGFRVREQGRGDGHGTLEDHLRARHVQVPTLSADDTKAVLPRLDLFERMVEVVGGCDPLPGPATADGEAS
ncbi:hypothetical protein I3F60_07630 [Streptomyces sp. MUM 136J]|nr:hypothetical protein [Streptomyces sp. MUM 2J]MCH0569129.1 hypothetical protein [Streptomyces sp. MUM 136J]